ncbi:MAG: tetratricopeptide repeat protein [Treponema sp.]|jgi:putative GTP pyrophosphokinase|nr:tetratricopeptide repeat protein [Treponema sp.]
MSKRNLPDKHTLQNLYEQYASVRAFIVKDIENRIEKTVGVLSSRPTVKGRVKDFESYYKKYLKLLNHHAAGSPPPLITDLIGIRIVCPFFDDLTTVEGLIKKAFEVIEVERKGSTHSFKEFGYESTHLLIRIPGDMTGKWGPCGCEVAEIQIRTILQDAWAEVEHELVYKAEFTPFDKAMKRKLAAINASLSLADTIFQEVRTYQRQLNVELGKRRDSFFKKIEESTDALLFTGDTPENVPPELPAAPLLPPVSARKSIDDLLLNALYAHNRGQFNEAIAFYTHILAMDPDNTIKSLIYKHRGMAHFARSHYEAAIDDFTQSLELDPKSYKAFYYRGVVRAVLQQFIEAIDDFTRSLDINPYQSFCRYRRGLTYYHIDDYPQALADCEAALALEPDSEPARKFKGLLLDKLKM